MDAETGRTPEIYAEIDYLWTAMKAAQEESLRLTGAYAANKSEAEGLKAGLARLENSLRKSSRRELALKAEISSLKTEIEKGAAALGQALASEEEARRLQEELNALQSRLAGAENLLALKESRLKTLGEKLKGAMQLGAGKENLIAALQARIQALRALPEISGAILRDSAAAGRKPAVFEELLARLENEAARGAALSDELARMKAETEKAAEKRRGLEKAKDSLQTKLGLQKRKAQELSAELARSAEKLEISSWERRRLERELSDLAAARADLEKALSTAELRRGQSAREAAARDARIAELEQALRDSALKTEEQSQNFAGAARTVFELQAKLANLRETLKQSRLDNEELSAALEGKRAEAEKLNALIREGNAQTKLEREINRRSLAKIKSLENEAEALKTRLAGAGEYAGSLLKKLEEREKHADALKKELGRICGLEAEIDGLKRHNLALAGFLKAEQAEFIAKLAKNVSKTAGDLKLFSVRLSTEQARHLSPTLKNLYGAANLLKAWQAYTEEGEFEKEDSDIRRLVNEAAASWEKAFKAKKLGFSAYVGAGQAHSNINPEKIKMAVYQLIKNAYENLTPGSSLKITLEPGGDGKYASLKLDDTGPGLPRSVVERLFTPFNTSKKDRVGLGLALACRLARLHGGDFTAVNKKDRGLLAELKLPLSQEHGEPQLK